MNRLFTAAVFAALLTVLTFSAANAAQWEMYVKNKPFASMKMVGGRPYVALGSFFDTLGFGYRQNVEGAIEVSRDPSVKNNLMFKYPSSSFVFEGRNFVLPVMNINGSTYAELGAAASNLGLDVTRYDATRMIEVVDRFTQTQHAERVAKSMAYDKAMGGKTPGQSKGKADFDREHPVTQVGEIEGQLDQVTTWEAFWKATVKNNADVPVNNVMLILHIQDGDGKDIDTKMQSIGTMNAGDTASADYYWQSTNHIVAFPKLEIKHDPLPKEDIKNVMETKNNVTDTEATKENTDNSNVTKKVYTSPETTTNMRNETPGETTTVNNNANTNITQSVPTSPSNTTTNR